MNRQQRRRAMIDANITAWHDSPAVFDGTPIVVNAYDSPPAAPHLYEPTTNAHCARCNRPREEH